MNNNKHVVINYVKINLISRFYGFHMKLYDTITFTLSQWIKRIWDLKWMCVEESECVSPRDGTSVLPSARTDSEREANTGATGPLAELALS